MEFFELSPEILSALQTALTVFVLYYLIFSLSLAIWTFQDIRRRTRYWPLYIVATALVLFFNLPGFLVYFLIRPPETLSQQYEQALEEAVILQDLGKQIACPQCKRTMQEDYIICPFCRTQLKHPCAHCGQALSAQWRACPYCTTPVGEDLHESATPAESVEPELEQTVAPPAQRAPLS